MAVESTKTGAAEPEESRPAGRADPPGPGEGASGLSTRIGIVVAAGVVLLVGLGLIYWFAGMVFMD